MLIRVSGKLANNASFSTRVEAGSAIDAVTKTGEKLAKAGQSLTDIRSINAQPVKEAGDVYLGAPKSDAEIAAAKQKRAEAKAAKAAGTSVPAAPAKKGR